MHLCSIGLSFFPLISIVKFVARKCATAVRNKMKSLDNCVRCLCLMALIAMVGCGAADGPKLVPVKGKVTVGGTEPFKKGLVVFTPKGAATASATSKAAPILGGSGITDDQGNFTLKHTSLKPGIEPGEYYVFFSLYQMPDGTPLPDQSKEKDPKPPKELGGVEFVPPDYSKITSTQTPATVGATGGTFEFKLPELKAQKSKK